MSKISARLARLELASRTQRVGHFAEACLCFPADEQPEFKWRAEAEKKRPRCFVRYTDDAFRQL